MTTQRPSRQRRWLLLVSLAALLGCATDTTFTSGASDDTDTSSGADAAAHEDAAAPRDTDAREDASPTDTREVEDTSVAGDTAQADTAAPPQDTAVADTAPEDTTPPCEAPEVHGEAPPLASLNDCGRLSYGLYANQGQSNAVHRLPDFSFAGYEGGGVAIPDVAAVVTVEPEEGDDLARIQAAIDAVSARPLDARGFRGAVELAAGTFQVGGPLRITTSGVVLRGAGQGTDGTVLRATLSEKHSFIQVTGAVGGEIEGTRTRITTAVVPVGSRSFEVEDASGFAVGDRVGVYRTPNTRWLQDLGMDDFGWTTSSYSLWHEREVTAIDGDRVTIDVPIVDAMEERYGGGHLFQIDVSGRVEHVGVEDLRLYSTYSGSTDEDHGWKAVVLSRVANSWVRRVTAVHFGYAAVSVEGRSRFNTVEECAMLAPISQVTGGRRYSFNVSGGTGALFQRCYSEDARHDFVTGSRTTGPNVWLDVASVDSSNDDGPHHRWSTGILLDNALSRYLHVENRRNSGTGHGWSGAQTMFWNGVADGIRCDAPTGAMNWTVGCLGDQREGGWAPGEPFGHWESHGRPVSVRSLYLQQLQDRRGPEAVRAVTTDAQRQGRIWGQLIAWRGGGRLADATSSQGDPTCARGVTNGATCCASSCGSCGGTGCGSRSGGASACCQSNIREGGRSCDVVGPPCVMSRWATVGE